MSRDHYEWKNLERRPGSSYHQLSVKGRRIWAWTLFCAYMSNKEPRTPQQIADDFNIPLEAVQEAIEYCQGDPPEITEDKRRTDILREAIGMDVAAMPLAE